MTHYDACSKGPPPCSDVSSLNLQSDANSAKRTGTPNWVPLIDAYQASYEAVENVLAWSCCVACKTLHS